MIIATLPVGMIQTNCYIAGCPETKEGAIIDPGGHPERILAEVERLGLSIKYVLNTHAHFDHTDANGAIVRATGAPLALHPQDLPLLKASGGAAMFGLQADTSPLPDLELQDGDELEVPRELDLPVQTGALAALLGLYVHLGGEQTLPPQAGAGHLGIVGIDDAGDGLPASIEALVLEDRHPAP